MQSSHFLFGSTVGFVEEYPPETSYDSDLFFLCTHSSLWGSMDFQGQLFCLPADSHQTFRDSCTSLAGCKSEKNRGWAPSFGENL